MKSKLNITETQEIVSDNGWHLTIGFLHIFRGSNGSNLSYRHTNGTTVMDSTFANFYPTPDNQWIYIVTVCDYTNKTLKAYRDGVLFGANNLTGTPQFPSVNRAKYVGVYEPSTNRLTDGSLDDVRIYSRSLSAEEILQQYNATKGEFGL